MKRPLLSLAVAAIAAASPLFAAEAAPSQACVGVLCAQTSVNGRTVYVRFEANTRPVTHFNVRRNGQQIELSDVRESFNAGKSARWSFAGKPGFKFKFHVQACNRGGFLQTSKCTGWATFTHTM